MSSHPTNAYHVRDHLAERAIYIKLAHQRGTFGVKINLEQLKNSNSIKHSQDTVEYTKAPKTIIQLLAQQCAPKTGFPLQRSADI